MRSDKRSSSNTFTHRARRAQLLRCAIEVIAERGYAGTTLQEIARNAGVSKGVVSYYFEGKDDLLLQVVGDVYRRAGAAIGTEVEAASGPVDALRRYVEANLGFLAEHPTDLQAVMEIAANLRDDAGGLRLRPAAPDPVAEHLTALLETGQRAGELGSFDPASVAIVIRAGIDAAAARLAVDTRFDLASYTRQLTDLIARATAPEPRS